MVHSIWTLPASHGWPGKLRLLLCNRNSFSLPIQGRVVYIKALCHVRSARAGSVRLMMLPIGTVLDCDWCIDLSTTCNTRKFRRLEHSIQQLKTRRANHSASVLSRSAHQMPSYPSQTRLIRQPPTASSRQSGHQRCPGPGRQILGPRASSLGMPRARSGARAVAVRGKSQRAETTRVKSESGS